MRINREGSRALLSGLMLLLAGCAPFVLASGKQTLSEYEVTVPEDWYRAMRASGTLEAPEGLVLTRDGLALQQIRVGRVPVDKELKFTNRKFDEKLPPHEVAEVELDDHRSNPNVFNLTIEENAPVTLDGHRGFRLVYTWQTKDGYRLKCIQYGFLEGRWVYQLTYQAAARFYFDRDLATFEKLRDSFRLLPKPS